MKKFGYEVIRKVADIPTDVWVSVDNDKKVVIGIKRTNELARHLRKEIYNGDEDE